MFLGSNCIHWHAKKQPVVARSSAEADYRSIAVAASEIARIVSLLSNVHIFLKHAPTLFCDNISVLYLTTNLFPHARTKHIEIDYHFGRKKVVTGTLVTKYVSAKNQLADLFTKVLPKTIFSFLLSKLGLHDCSILRLTGSIREY